MPSRLLDAVLPLRLRDYERFRILDRSLRMNFRDLNRCWVVATDAEHRELERRIEGDRYRVLPESAVVPEIRVHRAFQGIVRCGAIAAGWTAGRRDGTGWYVQQLIKLAIADHVETEFYLTLDADVVCMKPVGVDDLVVDGRGITNTDQEDVHPDWYASAERLLGVSRSGVTHGVTPALLAREAVRALATHLETGLDRRARWLGVRSWRSHLLRNIPWTEYALYHTFLEATGDFDRYHVDGGPEALCDFPRSIWCERDFEQVEIEAVMRGPAFFLVFQSNTGIAPRRIWQKLRPYLE